MSRTNYNIAQPCNLNKIQVYELAENIARQANFLPGGDLRGVLATLGGTVEVQNFWDAKTENSGSIYIDGKGKFKIYISPNTNRTRDRFTIAHEIGHYILHFLLPHHWGQNSAPVMATRYGGGRVEWEANWFAAAFLMPEDPFCNEFDKSNGDLTEIAKKFDVSMMAAEVRAQSIGLG